MNAAERLYLTADKARLVGEGHPDASFLFAAIGDEIPASAAERFGLVEGKLGLDTTGPGGFILRVATVEGVPSADAAGFHFTREFRSFASGDLDEGKLLTILKDRSLAVEAALMDRVDDWVAFPGRDDAIFRLQQHVDYDIANGRAHDPIGLFLPHPADIPALTAAPGEPPAQDTLVLKVGDAPADAPIAREDVNVADVKEDKPGKDKEAKPGKDKGAPPPPSRK